MDRRVRSSSTRSVHFFAANQFAMLPDRMPPFQCASLIILPPAWQQGGNTLCRWTEGRTGRGCPSDPRKREFLTLRSVSSGWVSGRGSLSEVRQAEVDIKERTNKRGGKGPTMRCNSDTGHKVVTSPTGQKPCRRRPLCVQSLVYKFIAHYTTLYGNVTASESVAHLSLTPSLSNSISLSLSLSLSLSP